jgi:hypothetical protein
MKCGREEKCVQNFTRNTCNLRPHVRHMDVSMWEERVRFFFHCLEHSWCLGMSRRKR